MSSELSVFDNFVFSDPFTSSTDSPFHLPFENLDEIGSFIIQDNTTPLDESSSTFNQVASASLSSSPPSVQLGNLSISQLGYSDYSVSEVKTEECHLNFKGFDKFLLPHFDADSEPALKFMKRSYSSNSFESKQNVSFRPQLDSVLEQNHILSSPEESSFTFGQMRRACSTGDLQNVKTKLQTRNVVSSSPLSKEKSLTEQTNYKVGRYNAEERKERIDRYRAKRNHRNFNKTIKYTCRKTLADNRTRIRGRFARSDEVGEIPKASMSQRYEDENDLWIGRFYDEDR